MYIFGERMIEVKDRESENLNDLTYGNKNLNLVLESKEVGNLNFDMKSIKEEVETDN